MSQGYYGGQQRSGSVAPPATRHLDREATALVEGLFDDLDRLLGGGDDGLEAAVEEALPSGSALATRAELRTLLQEDTDVIRDAPPPPATVPVAPVPETAAPHSARLLSVVACLACLGALSAAATWFGVSHLRTAPEASVAAPPAEAPDADPEFIDYMLRSLDAIQYRDETRLVREEVATRAAERDATERAAAAEVARYLAATPFSPPPPPEPPAPAAAAAPAPPPPSRARRAPARPARANAIAPAPSAPLPPPPPLPALPPPGARAATAPAPSPAPSPAPTSAPEPSIPTFSQPSVLSAAPEEAIEFVPEPPPPPDAPTAATGGVRAGNYALVGLLELGEQSAALVRVDGTTQRFVLGEAIGNSGWQLAEVAERRVVVRRDGRERVLGIGDALE